MDLSALHEAALEEYFSQAVVGYFNAGQTLCEASAIYDFDFGSCSVADLRNFTVPFDFPITKTAIMHGLGCWFDTNFDGSVERVVLSTAPTQPGTHWSPGGVLAVPRRASRNVK